MGNNGSVDKIIRVLIAALISILNYTHKISAFYSTALLLVVTILLVKSLMCCASGDRSRKYSEFGLNLN